VGVLARGWVANGPEAPVSRDTGDLRRAVELEVTTGVADSTRHDRAVVAAAERVGRDIARKTLGLPAAADEL
jgi:cytochrome oxidase assembly protein ShyY1